MTALISQVEDRKMMLGDITRKYLEELQKSQQKKDDLDVRKNSFDETSEDTYEVLTSEYNVEVGPIKINVKKSKTTGGTKSLSRSASQALNKQELLTEGETVHRSQNDSAKKNLPTAKGNSINIIV
ncbi:MAG: hypothetical protein NE330_21695 [Lentisphaeraceae bacterium]|nr:hypothetical protein [Lentisphaeraceae bacterium]